MQVMSEAMMQGVQGGGRWADFVSGVKCGLAGGTAVAAWLAPEPTGLTKFAAYLATSAAIAECGSLFP